MSMSRSMLSPTSTRRSPLSPMCIRRSLPSLTSMPRSLLSLMCTLPELPPLLMSTPLPLPPLHTPVTTTASLPVRTLTLATLFPLPSPPLPRNREFHRGRHIGQYFPRLHPDKKSDEHATSD